MEKYDPKKIEKKWQKEWDRSKVYEPDIAKAKKPFYNLMMFPYPSAEGLHVGSMFTFSGIDAFGRFKRMQGYDVFEPIGLDAFGIHSENHALKTNSHPVEHAKRTEANFYRQLHEIGNGFDWSHTLETDKPDYYKWTQWIFLKLYEKGLAVKKKAPVKWCPSCLTVLSDEQVINDKCERCNSEVVIKDLEQWFFKITEYSERLLQNLEVINWDESVKTIQRNWIGKKTGAEISFTIKNNQTETITVFTTRPDTLYGVTALALAPEHPVVQTITKDSNSRLVQDYIKQATKKTEQERTAETKVKTGVKTGAIAINPLTNEEIPIYVADYIISTYGTGAIMLVPAHDQRDFEFAKQFDLPIKTVIVDDNANAREKSAKDSIDNKQELPEVTTNYGTLVNSGPYTGLSSEKASEKIIAKLEDMGMGTHKTSYHLRDWLISRQRYWGPPIPIIYCNKCGIQPVPEKDLPVELPYIEDFRPTGTGKSPLANHPDFYNTTCPKCGGKAVRETDVSDTFLDSSWYFLRYPSVGNNDVPFDKTITKKWLPVDSYIGGKEHAVLHLMYTRFITMVLHDMGYLSFEEPFKQFRINGLIIKDGAKMSKSKGNVINPDDYIEKYGSDTLRTYLAFIGPFGMGGDFRDTGIAGTNRFINRIWALAQQPTTDRDLTKEEAFVLHKTIKKVTEDIEVLHYNTAIAAVMELTNFMQKQDTLAKTIVRILLQLLAPFAPHVTEELWQKIGQDGSIHTSSWPVFDESLLAQDVVTIAIQINGKTRATLEVAADASEETLRSLIQKNDKLTLHLEGKEIKRLIYIPGKIANIVV